MYIIVCVFMCAYLCVCVCACLCVCVWVCMWLFHPLLYLLFHWKIDLIYFEFVFRALPQVNTNPLIPTTTISNQPTVPHNQPILPIYNSTSIYKKNMYVEENMVNGMSFFRTLRRCGISYTNTIVIIHWHVKAKKNVKY